MSWLYWTRLKRCPKCHRGGGEPLQSSSNVVNWRASNATTRPTYFLALYTILAWHLWHTAALPAVKSAGFYQLRMSRLANTCVTSLLPNILLLRIGVPSASKRDHLHLITMTQNQHRARWPSVLCLSLVYLFISVVQKLPLEGWLDVATYL